MGVKHTPYVVLLTVFWSTITPAPVNNHKVGCEIKQQLGVERTCRAPVQRRDPLTVRYLLVS